MIDRRTTLAPGHSPGDDPLVVSTAVCFLAGGVTRMTVWRWVKAGILPAPTVIRGRNYWRKSQILAAIENAMDGGAPDGQGCREVAS